MIDALSEKHARLLVGYCCDVQAGENVLVGVSTYGLPLARAIYREVVRAGGIPHLRLTYPEMLEDLLALAPDEFFDTEPAVELSEAEHVDASMYIIAAHNTRSLQGVHKSKYARYTARNKPVRDVFQARGIKWNITLHPTEATAQDAGMSLEAFERLVYDSMFLYDDDPAARWGEIRRSQDRLIELLTPADVVRIVADGTDLRLRVKGRTWRNSDGRTNMPSGEVYTGPIEDSASGYITFGVRSSINGVDVNNVRLTFENGRVVQATAASGEDMLEAQLGVDAGARFLGELGIGTNYNITTPTGNVLLDEKIGGTVHLALGASIPGTGGRNDSAIHWDMICDLRSGGAIYLDDELFQKNGDLLALSG